MKPETNSVRILGVDTGGTFTDFVYYEKGQLTIHKVLSTPGAPEQAILQGITELDLMTYKTTLTLLSIFLYAFSYGQTDSTSIGGFMGLRGMWQTGNLNQINLMPNFAEFLSATCFLAQLLTSEQELSLTR